MDRTRPGPTKWIPERSKDRLRIGFEKYTVLEEQKLNQHPRFRPRKSKKVEISGI